jgi:acetyl esterase/lipase
MSTRSALQFDLWPDSPPELLPNAAAAVELLHPSDGLLLTELHYPTLTVHPAPRDRATGAAVIVCPGGGYRVLAVEKEGIAVARWLNHHGITAGVLHYRLLPNRYPAALRDALRALRMMREQAPVHGYDPSRIGIMGFSAGGHLAASLSVLAAHPDAEVPGVPPSNTNEPGPAFSLLFYAAISLGSPAVITHTGSREALIGTDPSPELVKLTSLHLQVTPATPPTFLAHTHDDPTVPVAHSRVYFEALRAAGVSAELSDTHSGQHGLGIALDSPHPAVRAWSEECANWLRQRGLAH